MSQPAITVYIPSHNYGRFLGDAVESVLRQKRSDWELLIIDDGSSDDTADVMARYRGDARVRLFRTEGIGLPAVCNLALREARADYIIRLDGDDLFDPHILLVLGDWLDREPDIALVFPDYFVIDEGGEVFGQERQEAITNQRGQVDVPPNGACALVRTDALRQLGGYREDLGAQDGFDLWTRLAGTHKVANVNLPLFYYRRHKSNLTNNSLHILSARRRIKKDAVLSSIPGFKPFIAVIPCRSSYDFRPSVWNEPIGNLTLLRRNIQTCLASPIFDFVVVAGDQSEVSDVVDQYSDPRLRFFQRTPSDTLRSTSLVRTLEKVVAQYDPDWQGVSVVSYVQAPFVSTDTLEEAVYTLVMNQTDSSIGVEEIDTPIYRRVATGLQPVNPPRALSHDVDRVYREANTALATRNRNLRNGSLMGPSVAHFIVQPDECFFINSDTSLAIARLIAQQ